MTRKMLSALAITVLFAAPAAAQENQPVGYSIEAINELVVAGSPSLSITTSAQLAGVTDESASWTINTNQTGTVVNAKVSVLPAGVTLKSLFMGATGSEVTLSGSDQPIASFGKELASGSIQYTLSATHAAGVVSGNATVTYTVVAGS